MIRTLVIAALVFAGACALLAGNVQAHPAWGIAFDRQGQIYFSDLETVWKIDAQGRLTVFRASTGGSHVHDLYVDEAGNLYGAENSYEPATKRFFSAVWKMTPAGDFSYLLARTDDPPEGIGVTRDRDGNTYHVGNHPGRELIILQRTPSGSINVLVGSDKAVREYRQGVPYSVGGLAFGPDGSLYFTHGANASRVTMKGALTTLAGNLVLESAPGNQAGSPTHLLGIAVDAQGTAFVADYGNRRVLKITKEGQASTLLRTEESWFPTGVALRGNELYILENGHTPSYKPTGTRVRKWSPDGRVTVLATVAANSNAQGENATPAAGESSSGESSGRGSVYVQRVLYIVLVTVTAAAAIFALTIIIRRARRRTSLGISAE